MRRSVRILATAFAAMLLVAVSTMPVLNADRIPSFQHTDIDLPGGA